MDMNLPSLCCGKSGVSYLNAWTSEQTIRKQMHTPFIWIFIWLDPTQPTNPLLKIRHEPPIGTPVQEKCEHHQVTKGDDLGGLRRCFPTNSSLEDAKVGGKIWPICKPICHFFSGNFQIMRILPTQSPQKNCFGLLGKNHPKQPQQNTARDPSASSYQPMLSEFQRWRVGKKNRSQQDLTGPIPVFVDPKRVLETKHWHPSAIWLCKTRPAELSLWYPRCRGIQSTKVQIQGLVLAGCREVLFTSHIGS